MSERFLGELKISEFIFEENDCHGPLTESLLLSNKSFGPAEAQGFRCSVWLSSGPTSRADAIRAGAFPSQLQKWTSEGSVILLFEFQGQLE